MRLLRIFKNYPNFFQLLSLTEQDSAEKKHTIYGTAGNNCKVTEGILYYPLENEEKHKRSEITYFILFKQNTVYVVIIEKRSKINTRQTKQNLIDIT